MNRFMAFIVAAAVLLGSAVLWAAEPRDEMRRNEDPYALIVRRNIFSRTRTSFDQPSTRPSAPRPELSYVLTGVVRAADAGEGTDDYLAFIEDTRTSSTIRLKVGDAIASGRITEIGFDYVQYESGGRATKVEIGMNFDRGSPTMTATTDTSDLAAPPSGGSVEDRMRYRRRREYRR